MPDQNSAFVGTIPENYDCYLGPTLFEPYAQDMARRVQAIKPGAVLELACGTGILTKHLRAVLPPETRFVATDLNEDMLKFAQRKFGPNDNIEWKQADMTALPFRDAEFDLVVSQFGLMFPPDKAAAVREALRVLSPGGHFLFSVWDAVENAQLADVVRSKIGAYFESDPPNFCDIPFCMYDTSMVRALLADAGFVNTTATYLELPSISTTAFNFARGFLEGNPVILTIQERATADVNTIELDIAREIAARYGDNPARASMAAYIWRADHP